MNETKTVDLTEAQVLAIAEEVRAVLAPLAARYRMKYVVSAAVEKRSNPELGSHFVLTSETKDPMWAVIALARSAQTLKPSADAQSLAQKRQQNRTRS